MVRDVAARLKQDGVRVWLDEEQIKPGDSIPAKIEEGLEHSRVLVLCMSANAFGSVWAQLEAGTFRFRDPLNKDRRFIPLRLDDAPIRGSLTQFLYINWRPAERGQEYAKLLEACRLIATESAPEAKAAREQVVKKILRINSKDGIWTYGFSSDGECFLTGGDEMTVRLWNLSTGRSLRTFEGHTDRVDCVALSADRHRVLSGGVDRTLRLWDSCLRWNGRRQQQHSGDDKDWFHGLFFKVWNF